MSHPPSPLPLPPRPPPRRRSTDASGGLDYYWSALAGTGPSSSSSPSPSPSPSPSRLHEGAYSDGTDSGSSASRYSSVDNSTPIVFPPDSEADEFSTPVAPPWQERPDLRPPLFPVLAQPSSPERAQTVPMAGGAAGQYPSASPPPTQTPQTTTVSVQRALGDTPRSAPAQQSEFDTSGEVTEETRKGRNRRTLPAGIPSSATSLAGLLDGSIEPNRQQDDIVSSPTSISPSSTQHQLPTITRTPHSPVSSSPSSNTPARPDRSPSRGATPTLPYSSSVSIAELTELLGGAIDEIGLIDSRDTPPPTVGEPSKHERIELDKAKALEPKAKELEPKAKELEPAAEVVNKGPMTPTSLPTRGASLSSTRPTSPTPAQRVTEMGAGVASSLPLERTTSSTLSVISSPNPPFSSGPAGPLTLTYSPTILSFSKTVPARPWPPAMSISTVKSHKSAGDRALAYARAINEIARTETGLKEWCATAAAAGESHRRLPPIHHAPASVSTSASAPFALSPLSHSSSSSPFEFSPHPRNVSTGSEFPMRADSYTAREISQRVMDPADQPTALPANLPYPQLQLQAQFNHHHQSHLLSSPGRRGGGGGGGLKPSQSMQSVSSFTSTKKGSSSSGGGGGGGFFSNIRKGGSKKENLSLGPPGGYIAMTSSSGGGGGSVGKKDVRGLPISAPRSTSPQKPATATTTPTATATATTTATTTAASTSSPQLGSATGSHTPRTVASPMGPRPLGPRGTSTSAGRGGRGSFTPPPSATNTAQTTTTERGDNTNTSTSLPPLPGRASLDTSLSRITTSSPRAGGGGNARGSMDSVRRIVGGLGGKTSVPQPQPQPLTSPPVSSGKGIMMDNNNHNNSGEDVKYMADVLPYVEKSVLRGYLKRHGGDQMRALGAYLEDEKNGVVR
ncbi:hypothetical protein I309_02966 [Cryptococcus deuterogattii LA55]|nr:hypothetical protein I309_02966 [Cryptococcus deuterogattii LA55]